MFKWSRGQENPYLLNLASWIPGVPAFIYLQQNTILGSNMNLQADVDAAITKLKDLKISLEAKQKVPNPASESSSCSRQSL